MLKVHDSPQPGVVDVTEEWGPGAGGGWTSHSILPCLLPRHPPGKIGGQIITGDVVRGSRDEERETRTALLGSQS